MKKGANNDIETGTKPKSNKTVLSTNKKCSILMIKVALASFVVAVFIAYFMAISRNSNLIGNFQEFDVAIVTNSPLMGNFLASIHCK